MYSKTNEQAFFMLNFGHAYQCMAVWLDWQWHRPRAFLTRLCELHWPVQITGKCRTSLCTRVTRLFKPRRLHWKAIRPACAERVWLRQMISYIDLLRFCVPLSSTHNCDLLFSKCICKHVFISARIYIFVVYPSASDNNTKDITIFILFNVWGIPR